MNPSDKYQILSPPAIHSIPGIQLPEYGKETLSNGIPVYFIGGCTQDVVKIEWVFLAGKSYEAQRTVAKCTAALLAEGTAHHTSEAIAEHFDFYGAVISSRAGVDTARIRLYCMNKHLSNILPVLKEVIENPIFPQEEIDTFLENQIERIKIELQKNEVIGYRKLTEAIFGESHPYGYNTELKDLDLIDRKLLQSHHKRHYRTDNVAIFISGRMQDETIHLLDKHFGQRKITGNDLSLNHQPDPTDQRNIYVPGPQTHQAAIRIGRPFFKRSHADFPGLYVANALLGGYFGSRLMMNLREEKGYTYGIYSSVDTFRQGGCLYISTEVAQKNVDQSLEQIYLEIERLKTDPVPESELQMVKNYLMGHLMMQLDGPFNSMDVIKSLLLETNSTIHFETLIQKIKDISPQEINSLIKVYFDRNDLIEIVVRN